MAMRKGVLGEVLAVIEAHRTVLETTYKVKSLAVFGSVARDEARPDSDVDLLVEFDGPVGLFHFVEVKEYLKRILGRPVDLVMREGLKRQLKDRILKEAVSAR